MIGKKLFRNYEFYLYYWHDQLSSSYDYTNYDFDVNVFALNIDE